MKIVEKNIGGYTMKIRSDQGGIHGDLIRKSNGKGEREPELLYVLRKEIVDGMTCMDLGANIGYITLLMAGLVGSKGKVYAIEPDPENYKLLGDNIRINGLTDKVEMFHLGLSNKDGKSNFYIGKSSNLSGMAKSKNTSGSPIRVNVSTMTSFCRERAIPSFIKMDIEGHEVEVLEGMYDLISNSFPCKIVMELHPTSYTSDHSLERWMRKFLECGFRTKYVISAGVVVPDLFADWGYTPQEVFGSRGLYVNFTDEHMIEACCHKHEFWVVAKRKMSPKIARYVMIER